jgi:succinate dehydrogenase / fumarate reductase cytochrome b subunit
MGWITRTLTSSIGLKLMMALSGLGMVGFLLGHLSGNLLVFAGPEALNAYAEGLRTFPAILNGMRAGLVLMVILHIFTAIKLTKQNKDANPQKYQSSHANSASIASRSMAGTGFVILVFIFYHLAHLTWRMTHPEFQQLGPFDAYTMIVESFKSLPLSLLYIVGVSLIGLHLSHGISSACHTLGLNHKKYTPLIKNGGAALSVALVLGFISIPISVLLGIVK